MLAPKSGVAKSIGSILGLMMGECRFPSRARRSLFKELAARGGAAIGLSPLPLSACGSAGLRGHAIPNFALTPLTRKPSAKILNFNITHYQRDAYVDLAIWVRDNPD